jgi:hypothetical protein
VVVAAKREGIPLDPMPERGEGANHRRVPIEANEIEVRQVGGLTGYATTAKVVLPGIGPDPDLPDASRHQR